eukprot:7384091-Prymnesium_polylepis.1
MSEEISSVTGITLCRQLRLASNISKLLTVGPPRTSVNVTKNSLLAGKVPLWVALVAAASFAAALPGAHKATLLHASRNRCSHLLRARKPIIVVAHAQRSPPTTGPPSGYTKGVT